MQSSESQYTVLVPVSLPSAGPGLVRAASALAEPGREPRICALHLESVQRRGESAAVARERVELREEALGGARAVGAMLGLQVETRAFGSAAIVSDIVDAAYEENAELILLGWTKPVLGRSIPSATVNDVFAHATTDVAVFFERTNPPWRSVLIPFAGGPHDRFAIDLASRLVESGARATVLHIVDPERPMTEPPVLRSERGNQFADERVTLKVVPSWDPVGETVRESRRGYDLIVFGVAATWRGGQQPFGPEHERIARESDASLLIVRKHVPAEHNEEWLRERRAAASPARAAAQERIEDAGSFALAE